MIDCLCDELRARNGYLSDQKLETIYFGGGTPSLLSAGELDQILTCIKQLFELSTELEMTLEANPDDITASSLEMWKKKGINRLSIGLQSFKAEDLKWMNRAHSVDEAENCLKLISSAGFENVTVDLMYGLPELNEQEWKNHIQRIIDAKIPHISAYCLTVEEKTALHNWVANNQISPTSEDLQSEQFMLLVELLEQNGYNQYEISNFSLEGFESRHNSNYWKGTYYLGIGPSAHSFNGTSRTWNVSNNHLYMKGVFSGEMNFELEELSPENRFNEKILTGLRTSYGVNLEELHGILDTDENFEMRLSTFIDNGWIAREAGRIFTTREGKLRTDYLAMELFQ